MTPGHFTAFWLVAQFLGLVILYHAGPWPWASRALSMVAALIPSWALLVRSGWLRHQLALGALAVVTSAVFAVTLVNVATEPDADHGATVFAYRAYVWTYIAAQAMLAFSWLVWWNESELWPALGGGFLAAIGAAMSAWVHGLRPAEDILEMRPWTYMWSGDHGPIDVISRVAPQLASVEVLVLGGASVGLAAIAWKQ